MTVIGEPIERTDGMLKVTGNATYTAEHTVENCVYAALVTSTIAHGRILLIDCSEILQLPGVLNVMTHLNAPRLPGKGRGTSGRVLSLLQDDVIHFSGQPVAVVLATTLEVAQHAAHRVVVHYERQLSVTSFDEAKQHATTPLKVQGQPADSTRGEIEVGLGAASARLDLQYTTPVEHHHPMEPHATIALWDGNLLTLYDATQSISGTQKTVAAALGIPTANVRVICPFVGGGFGSKGSTWSHVVLTAMAAKRIGRPVKLVLDRTQMVGPVGARPMTEQTLCLGATERGKVIALRHQVISTTSFQEDWTESSAIMTRMLYDIPHLHTSHRLARMHLGTPTFMRAPGEASGSFALESALDEMACLLDIDPVQLRLQNYAEVEPTSGKPWSSKSLRACYQIGAERFGWSRRTATPRSMRNRTTLIGWGMATATYPAFRQPASASARWLADGTALIRCATQDLGTGTYTVLAQIAADALGLPMNRIRVELGDSTLPPAPISGGSQTVASVGPAVHEAAVALRLKVIERAVEDPLSPFWDTDDNDIDCRDGTLCSRADPLRLESIVSLLGRHPDNEIEATVTSEPGAEQAAYAMHSFGAVFAEVHVDPDLGRVRVTRVTGVYGIGKLINQTTGKNQLTGGIIWGIGQALMEQTHYDLHHGRAVNGNLVNYHVPVNADIGQIDVVVVDEDDPHINSLGAKGIGEIGITGVAAAIANAVFHATGKRIRDLPITLDKLL